MSKTAEHQLLLPVINENKAPLCSCGCGLPVTWNKQKKGWNIYLLYHSGNDPIVRKTRGDSIKNTYKNNPELRERQRCATKKRYEDISESEKQSKIMKQMWDNSEFREKTISGMKKNYIDNPDLRNIIIESTRKTYINNPELREKQRASIKKAYENTELREIISKMMIERYKDPIEREKQSVIMKKSYTNNPEVKEKISISMKNNFKDIEYKENRKAIYRTLDFREKKSRITKKTYIDNPKLREIVSKRSLLLWQDIEFRNRITNSAKARWQDPIFIAKWFSSLKIFPNAPEILLSMLTPENIEYVGNGKWWRTLKVKTDEGVVVKRKNPDFLVKGQKKVIEFNGTYWHRNDYPDEVWHEAWARIGYQVLIIWEHELKDIDSVLKRIGEFIGQDSWQMSLNV